MVDDAGSDMQCLDCSSLTFVFPSFDALIGCTCFGLWGLIGLVPERSDLDRGTKTSFF